jgi:hypothetical protein
MAPGQLPEAVADLRVPERIRRPAGRLRKALSHPLVSDTIAGAVIAGAAALAEGKDRRAIGKAAGLGAAAAAVKASKGANRIAVALAIAVIELAAARIAAPTAKSKKKARKADED